VGFEAQNVFEIGGGGLCHYLSTYAFGLQEWEHLNVYRIRIIPSKISDVNNKDIAIERSVKLEKKYRRTRLTLKCQC